MITPTYDGKVALNIEGKRYTASFHLERGAMTVTSGCVSRMLEVGDVDSPESVARTVLRTMVMEGRAASASMQANAMPQAESRESIEGRDYFVVRPRSSRHSRTRH
jgi:hypothetical protein